MPPNTPQGTVNNVLDQSAGSLYGGANYGDSSSLTDEQRATLLGKLSPQAFHDMVNAAVTTGMKGQNLSAFTDPRTAGMITNTIRSQATQAAAAQYLAQIQELMKSEDPAVQAFVRQTIAGTDFKGAMAAAGVPEKELAKYTAPFDNIQGAIQASTPATPGLVDYAVERAMTPAEELDPANNPYLRVFGETAAGAVGGNLQNQWGAGGATQAGQAIGTAGQTGLDQAGQSYAALMGQGGQFGQDLGIIRDTAQGRGPSAAAILGQKMVDDSSRAMAAQAATARGGNIGASNRAAILGGQQNMLQGAQQIAALRSQEQLNAQGLLNQGNASLGNLYNQAGGLGVSAATQDIARATGSADALNRTYGTTAQAGIAGMGALGQAAGEYAQGKTAREDAEGRRLQLPSDILTSTLGTSTSGAVGFDQTDAQREISRNELRFKQREADRAFYTNIVSGLAQAGGSALTMGLKK